LTDLDPYLAPMPFSGEALRFDLGSFRSTVTRQMLQVRLRMTAVAFGVDTGLIAANVTPDGAAIEVDAAALMAANATVRVALEAGPEGALSFLRKLSAARASLDRVARAVAAQLRRGTPPGRKTLLRYVGASAHDQALGSLKFCLPDTLRARLGAWLEDPALLESLLAPEAPTLWSVLSGRELALAEARLHGPAGQYRRRLVRHQRAYGYLFGEDVDFRAHETPDAIDARLAALGAGGATALAAERRRLAVALAGDRAQKARARQLFAERLQSENGGEGVATLVSQVLLARALVAHEDTNRRAKMRLLRDLRDLADLAGLDLERAGLVTFAGACASAPAVPRRPVLRST
jgi:hypothetical protein